MKLWKASTGLAIADLQGHTDAVRSISFSQDGKLLLSGALDRSVRAWDTESCRARQVFEPIRDNGGEVAVTPDGREFATIDGSSIVIWNLDNGQVRLRLTGPDERGKKRLHPILKQHDEFYRLAMSTDGKVVAAVGSAGVVVVWDIDTGHERFRIRTDWGAARLTFSRDSTMVAGEVADDVVKVWNATTGAELMALKQGVGGMRALAFSPDGKSLAVGGRGVVVLLDIASRKVAP